MKTLSASFIAKKYVSTELIKCLPMKPPTVIKVIVLGMVSLLLSFLPCQSQETFDFQDFELITTSDALIRDADETIQLMSFAYSHSSKAYEATTSTTSPLSDEVGFKSVFISFNDGEEFLYLPHADEDARSLKKGTSAFVYAIDLEGLIKVSIRNPQGGTPWSNLDIDQFTLRVYHTDLDLDPYQQQGLDLEDEIVFGFLTEQYLDNQLTVW